MERLERRHEVRGVDVVAHLLAAVAETVYGSPVTVQRIR